MSWQIAPRALTEGLASFERSHASGADVARNPPISALSCVRNEPGGRRKCQNPQALSPAGSGLVELGRIELPSIRHSTFVLRPFPTHPLTQRHRRVGWPPLLVARESSFRIVIGLSRRQQSFPLSSPASVAGLRWIGPVRHFWSRCLFTHLKIRRRERTARWQFLWLPRLASLSNSGRTLVQTL